MEAYTARAEHASAAADAEAAEVVKTHSTSTPPSLEAAAAAAGAQGGAEGRTEPVGEGEEVLQTSPAGAQPLGAAPPAAQDGPR